MYDFDPITHSDGDFIEVTIRYFLELMSSPQNPLNKLMIERTGACYLIIYIVNQLFLSSNDIIELGWLTKFDSVLFKAGDKSVSPALVEFAGSVNDNTSNRKNSNDIKELYVNMVKIRKDTGADKMFCMRCYDHQIFFEKLIKYDDTMYRIIDASMEVPNTPQKLLAYVKEITSIFAWNHAVINQIAGL
ncbi:hypothetical protein K501DRAFT_294854 [Backusella circina FSU 941]|nr:hypothetical protein K501DRAFT_294854 [Backusella circina FSU 941]